MSPKHMPSLVEPVGLFPLPNAVLLPGTTLPLQVHEARYRLMIEDALADQNVIAMALLQPGYEAYYHTNLADIHSVVCVGSIREHVRLPDGRYFINLFGLCRARVRQEDRNGEYRLAMLDPMVTPTSGVEADGEYAARYSLRQLLCSATFDGAEDIERARNFVASDLSLGEIVDRIASGLLPAESVEILQNLLEEMQAIRRAKTLLSELRLLGQVLKARQQRANQWPRFGSMN